MQSPALYRREMLKAATMGLAGVGTVHGATSPAIAVDDHDHSGDQLGAEEPVESIRANNVTIRDFDQASSILVFERDDRWYGYRPRTQDIEFESDDGVVVINEALDSVVEDPEWETQGAVRVVADEGGTTLRSSSTIDFTRSGTSLVLERGVTFEYTGADQAVDAAGNTTFFSFDVIDANGADYCIHDVGLGTGMTVGTTLRGASEILFFLDSEERSDSAGHYINIREFDCTAHPTPVGFKAPSVSRAKREADEGGAAEGYWADIGVIRGPTKTGIQAGTPDVASSTGFFLFNTFIDGASGNAERLVEIHDHKHAINLHGYTPATGGEWDIEVSEWVQDGPVIASTRRNDLRVKRDVLQTADLSKFDPFGDETVAYDETPVSLDAYETIARGSGDVALEAAGHIEHRTGLEPLSWANIRKRINTAFKDPSFDNPGVLQTSVMLPDDLDQEAWLVWGDRDGPAVGWHVVGDVIEGYVHDGEDASVVNVAALTEGTDAFSLTAFYNPPTDVVFYMEDLHTEEVTTSSTGLEATAPILPYGHAPATSTHRDLRWAGKISSNLPSGETGADRVMTIDFRNLVAGNKRLRWSNWKNHRYPSPLKGGDPA